MIRFYSPDIETAGHLPESDSKHCVRVLRMHAGDAVEVVDGKGFCYRCILADENTKSVAVEIVEKLPLPPVWDYNITIGVAPTKHLDRMEWLVEKLTEIGVNRIVPLLCRHSERKEIKVERLEKIAVSAMKQSLKAVLPEITPMMPFCEFLKRFDAPCKYIGYCSDSVERRILAKEYQAGRDAVIAIGPEGDFTADEVNEAFARGFQAVTMGDNRLRTETAALVGCDTVHIINQTKL